ncbi:MAG TPA: hypothetical protein DCO79_00630 [Spirochaeta sp.]|nr:hypothetical protein [Spirochaeta sp.]
MKNGLSDVRVHVYIQSFIYIFVPLYFFLTSMLFRDKFGPQIITGIYALAVLPCTISSCIVFTQSAGGNVVATMFNTAFANIIGVLVSPLLLSLMMRSSAGQVPASELLGILQKLGMMMLLPILFGQFLRRWFAAAAETNRKQLGVVSNIFILLILYLSFSKSAGEPSFVENLRSMVFPYLYLAGSFLILIAIASGGAAALGFSHGDRITVVFTAPQKTLAMGVPLLSTYFASDPELLGIALLPLIFYHPWQLFVSGILQETIKKRNFSQL